MTKKEILTILEQAGACEQSISWVKSKRSVKQILNCGQGGWWAWLMVAVPGLEQYCRWDALDLWDWIYLLQTRPELAEYRDWKSLSSDSWVSMNYHLPEYMDRCDWNSIESWDLTRILLQSPQRFKSMDPKLLESIKGEDWAYLMQHIPSVTSDYCDFSKISDKQWVQIIARQPYMRKFRPKEITS